MQLIEIYMPSLDLYVRYRVLPPARVDEYVEGLNPLDADTYMQAVLEMAVENLSTDVAEYLAGASDEDGVKAVSTIYNGCVMLNPGFDIGCWLDISEPPIKMRKRIKKFTESESTKPPLTRTFTMSKASFSGLAPYLEQKIVGQSEAVATVSSALKRAAAGISDPNAPLGVFMFSGASGTGKTQLAKELQKYLFGDHPIVRIDCGEYQHKHENQKLGGAPPAYVGHENGGYLTESMKANPKTVVLLDEVEKAHRDIWDTFLRVFDEGVMVDGQGNEVSFKDAIIIMTTNLGNRQMVDDLGEKKVGFIHVDSFNESKYERYANDRIKKHFRPEFLNRIDKIVHFNYLNQEDLRNIAAIEMDKLDERLSESGYVLNYADSVLDLLAGDSLDPVEGARVITRLRRDLVEDRISDVLLERGKMPNGTNIDLACEGGQLIVEIRRPHKEEPKELSVSDV